MPALAAAAFKNDLAGEELRTNGGEPTEKLLRVIRPVMVEVLPRPTELFCGRGLIWFDFACLDKTWYASHDGKPPATACALEFTFDYFARLLFRH